MTTQSIPACPICGIENTLSRCNNLIYLDCYHEWSATAQVEIEEKRIHKDAHGNVLNDGNAITLIKNLKVQGSSLATKGVTKIKNIRLIDYDHDIDCKVDCQSMFLKSQFMKKF